MIYLVEKQGNEAAVDFAMACLEGKSPDDIAKICNYMREDMIEVLAPRLYKDPRFN
jgi:hypothetical protein